MSERMPFQRIDVLVAKDLIQRDDVLVLDVRDSQSFGSAHIEGARNVSITNLTSVIDTTARSMPIIILLSWLCQPRICANILRFWIFPSL